MNVGKARAIVGQNIAALLQHIERKPRSTILDLGCGPGATSRCLPNSITPPVDPVSVEQPQGYIQPLPTPPRPPEALAIPGMHHMAQSLMNAKHSPESPIAK
jgi:hypothetical protein